MPTITLNVEGMSCGGCASKVEGAIKDLGAEGKVDLAAKSVTISYEEGKVTVDALKAAIEDKGFDVV
ncbi:cation transporter [Paenibacillus durus]|uniref:Copper resistance protein CopZ n=1 Tax=Paenibacillus durus ATCC 35681 TaxID=1333534 RepID=A0A0F7FCW2_PAEDU|nr:cation transporter [Paenibacillus durus]AKG36232.1 copper resistance protein CopZ [Paenibacillus durus ATCC 35681]